MPRTFDAAALAAALDARTRRSLPHDRRAAVLVPVIDDGGPLRLLLTRRTETLSTHRGQVAFPGGRIDADDAGPVDAALRESEEEIGLRREHVEVLGALDDFPTVRGAQVVTPVVARVARVPTLVAEAGEVARIFDIPVAALQDPAGWRVEHLTDLGRRWPVYFFDWDGEVLWGLSAYIAIHLLDVAGLGAPFVLPEVEVPIR